jgi:hypothetical protein
VTVAGPFPEAGDETEIQSTAGVIVHGHPAPVWMRNVAFVTPG